MRKQDNIITEAEIQRKILSYLRALPNSYILRPIICAESGTPDIIALVAGQYIAIEVKRSGKHLTKLQAHRMAQIGMAGGIAICARNVEDVKKCIDKIPIAPTVSP